MDMKFYRPHFSVLIVLILFVLSACNNSTDPAPNTAARLLEFSINEFPEVTFSVDDQNKFIHVNTSPYPDTEADWTNLTASFTVSEGASVFIDGVEQTSDETSNDFSEGLFYTVVSEDETAETTYFVYLSETMPVQYLLAGEPEIDINPSGRNPLAAQIHLQSRELTTVSVQVLGDIPSQKGFSISATQHSIPVLGLYPNASNKVVLTLVNSKNHTVHDTLTIETDALPDFLPTPEINVINEELMEPGMHFNDFHIGNNGIFESYPLIFDNNGDIRWITDLSDAGKAVWSIHFNGDGTYYFTHSNSIFIYDMLGNELNRIDMEGHITHHEIRKTPDGNYLIAVNKDGSTMIKNGEERTSVEDFVFEVSPSGEIVKEWDMAEILDVNRTDLTDGGHDWFHMNAIWLDESDNSLIISGRNQGLVKVSRENELQWILAPHKGWGQTGRYEKSGDTTPFLLTAIDDSGNPYPDAVQQGTSEHPEFSWVWGQHAPLILPNGNLFVFDNGFNRNFGAASHYSMAAEYEIDTENGTVKQVWSYGRDRGAELFSNIISDVDYLPETGNRLFLPGVVNFGGGSYSKIVEITHPDKQVVFEATLHFKNALANGQGWGNFDITYRGERVKLYGNYATAAEKR